MATYAVGDVQGCLDALQKLLDQAQFTPEKDTLWICGDLVNRGDKNLAALRFAKSLPNCRMVLGNHDLHLLAIYYGARDPSKKDTITDILDAPDCEDLVTWLHQQHIVYHDAGLGFSMVHAGIPPMWTLQQALDRAAEVENCLRSNHATEYFADMYGNSPDTWRDDLQGTERLRLITNYFTRMRFCDANGKLELKTKTGPDTAPKGYKPWYAHKDRASKNDKILFGHWAALEGRAKSDNVYALDTGCVWGGALSMLRLEDEKMFSVECPVTS